MEPHFANGKLNVLSHFLASYTLLQDIYLAIIQHKNDNPYSSDFILSETKSSLHACLKTDKVTKDLLQSKYVEIVSLLEKIMDGVSNEDNDDWSERETLMLEEKGRMDVLFSTDFEIPFQWLPDIIATGTPRKPKTKSVQKKKKIAKTTPKSSKKSGKSKTKPSIANLEIPEPIIRTPLLDDDEVPPPPPPDFDEVDIIPPPPPDDDLYDSYIPDTSVDESPPPPPPDYDSLAGSDDDDFFFKYPDNELLLASDKDDILEGDNNTEGTNTDMDDAMSSLSSENGESSDSLDDMEEMDEEIDETQDDDTEDVA